MDLIEAIKNLSGWGWAGIAVVITSIIQIAPIKFNPWSWIARQIGRALNQEVMHKQDEFQKETQEYRKKNDLQIKALSSQMDKRNAEDARNRILRFGDEIKAQVRHSQEYYNQILDDITSYDKYCYEHPKFKNERTVMTAKIIKESYEMHMRNNDFL